MGAVYGWVRAVVEGKRERGAVYWWLWWLVRG